MRAPVRGTELESGLGSNLKLEDNTITARQVLPDARRIRGLLTSPHATPPTVRQMDEAVSKHLRNKYAPTRGDRKPVGR